VPLNQTHTQACRYFLGQHCLAGSGLTFYQQGALKSDSGVNRHTQIIGCNVTFGTLKLFHKLSFIPL
jgi:hypothetical protein